MGPQTALVYNVLAKLLKSSTVLIFSVRHCKKNNDSNVTAGASKCTFW